ncbi:fibro-slime domain-containing protein [Sorangium sp. So ce1099]|uniref:fibro-slime domain-containing protein n=1 Tax=Sorangium sp. So ce1099 TaxID=3133331 RepID=UPI003F5FCEEF
MNLAHPEASLCRASRRPLALLLLACAALPLAGCPLQTANIARANGESSSSTTIAPSEKGPIDNAVNAGGGPPEVGGTSDDGDGDGDGGDGSSSDAGGGPGSSNAILCTATFPMIVRDFPEKHQDFGPSQTTNGQDIEPQSELQNGKPVAASSTSDGIEDGSNSFDQWFQDKPGVNITYEQDIYLDLWSSGGHLGGRDFYVVDDLGFGNEGEAHNYGFTVEFEVPFTYRVGGFFSFDSSDDVWISIDETIVASHSVHDGVNGATVRLDDEAGRLRMKPGTDHKLKVFYAERDGRSSVFRLNTSLDVPCEPIPK